MIFCLFLVLSGAFCAWFSTVFDNSPRLGLFALCVLVVIAVLIRFNNPQFFGVF